MHLILSTEKVSSPCHEVIGHMKSRTRERNVPVASKPHIHSLQELATARRFKAQDGIDSSEASFCVYLVLEETSRAQHSTKTPEAFVAIAVIQCAGPQRQRLGWAFAACACCAAPGLTSLDSA